MVDIWAGFHHICTLGSTTGKSFRTSKCCGTVTKAVRIDFPDSKPKHCKGGRKELVKCDLILGQCWRGSGQSIPQNAILEQWDTWNIFSSESNGATRHARKASNGSLIFHLLTRAVSENCRVNDAFFGPEETNVCILTTMWTDSQLVHKQNLTKTWKPYLPLVPCTLSSHILTVC